LLAKVSVLTCHLSVFLQKFDYMNSEIIAGLNQELTNLCIDEQLLELTKRFRGKVAFSSSLSIEDQVITHYIARLGLDVKVFTLDTGRMFPEVYDLIQRTQSRYKIPIHISFPDADQVSEMVNNKGINLFYESVENRQLCCSIRKIQPLKKALKGYEVWITGLRREQSVTRTDLNTIEWDSQNSILKANPLLNWTEEQVWDFITKNNIPFNPLQTKGYRSIGCQPCTRPVAADEDIRAGRWWWELPEFKECGLHKH
jgi:phosphoadenosine phosphosulfate reductase